MSRIPDCREDENYNEKYLSEHDSLEIVGYDECVEDVIDNFFYNTVLFADEFEYAGLDMTKLGDIDFDKDISEYDEDEIANMSKEELIVRIFHDALIYYAESHRDEIITSMLDNDDDYDKNKAKVDKEGYKNAIIRQREYKEAYDRGEVPTYYTFEKDEDGKIIEIGHCPNGTLIKKEK